MINLRRWRQAPGAKHRECPFVRTGLDHVQNTLWPIEKCAVPIESMLIGPFLVLCMGCKKLQLKPSVQTFGRSRLLVPVKFHVSRPYWPCFNTKKKHGTFCFGKHTGYDKHGPYAGSVHSSPGNLPHAFVFCDWSQCPSPIR